MTAKAGANLVQRQERKNSIHIPLLDGSDMTTCLAPRSCKAGGCNSTAAIPGSVLPAKYSPLHVIYNTHLTQLLVFIAVDKKL